MIKPGELAFLSKLPENLVNSNCTHLLDTVYFNKCEIATEQTGIINVFCHCHYYS